MPTDLVQNLLCAAMMECCTPALVKTIARHTQFIAAARAAENDLNAFAAKDPASRGAVENIAFGYSSYKAVLHYRLAHALLDIARLDGDHGREIESAAALVSARGKLLSGAEIHPRCYIGRGFVLDHGWGTVIGETSRIGDDCYILGGVVLGATGISANPSGKRHPTVGNRAEIGAFTRIFGDVVIGNDVFISPHCVITEDIPSDSIVTLKSELQLTRRRQPQRSLESR
ncbi:UDP-3-O-(3-hydroxymyristoyl)glucosamine N-acyltransferase [Paraburkholderia ultramafica]|uniref:serine O-acetyltransferase n=1 Tax=Paraburkholderia ultramafica TaxID=1544867 RepID=A0A6S7B539_9BURK|nr:serine O-acetyltransferase [Paraburkholderia ultramafica]CAB3788389.1 UDP-3-O-(3-hydroxymyristoyl)glucosamine N-acyltransferase [Paraburkholderia ultramafica]